MAREKLRIYYRDRAIDGELDEVLKWAVSDLGWEFTASGLRFDDDMRNLEFEREVPNE